MSGERPDIPAKTVAVRWLNGETYLSISIDYDCAPSTIRKRVNDARRMYPKLDWGRPRTVKRAENFGKYVNMNDGKQGHRSIPIGSIVPGRKRSLRGRG